MKKRKKPSKTRRHRESVAAKRKARAFYRLRSCGADVTAPNETAGGLSRRIALLAARTAIAAVVGSAVAVNLGILLWAVAKMF